MKTILFFTLLSFVFNQLKSQIYVRDKNINADSSIRYFEIMYDPDPAGFYIYSVDFGQNKNPWNDYITDSYGKKKKFRSGVELLHYITSNGWKLTRRDITTNSKSSQIAFLLFERM